MSTKKKLSKLLDGELEKYEAAKTETERKEILAKIKEIVELINATDTTKNDVIKTSVEVGGTVITTAASVIAAKKAADVWFAFESENPVTGTAGKELLRATIAQIFKKK